MCARARALSHATYRRWRAHSPCRICVWRIPWRNGDDSGHFNHFLLYLQQLLGEVEITARLCFDALPPPSDSTQTSGRVACGGGEPTCCGPRAFRLHSYRQPYDVGPSPRSNHSLASFCSRQRIYTPAVYMATSPMLLGNYPQTHKIPNV